MIAGNDPSTALGALRAQLVAEAAVATTPPPDLGVFFASLSLSGPRTAADVGHNFAGEADFVADLTKRDPRILHRR